MNKNYKIKTALKFEKGTKNSKKFQRFKIVPKIKATFLHQIYVFNATNGLKTYYLVTFFSKNF